MSCLMSPQSPPKNELAKNPDIAVMLNSYNLCKSLGCLPEAGGLLDQAANWVWYATIFGNCEAEYARIKNKEV